MGTEPMESYFEQATDKVSSLAYRAELRCIGHRYVDNDCRHDARNRVLRQTSSKDTDTVYLDEKPYAGDG